jgi:hypothetical protein
MGEELVCEETKVEQLAQELEKKAALKIEEEKAETGDLDAARDESSEKTQQTEQALLNDDLRHPLDVIIKNLNKKHLILSRTAVKPGQTGLQFSRLALISRC